MPKLEKKCSLKLFINGMCIHLGHWISSPTLETNFIPHPHCFTLIFMWYLLSNTVITENLAMQRLMSLQEMQHDLKLKLKLALHI